MGKSPEGGTSAAGGRLQLPGGARLRATAGIPPPPPQWGGRDEAENPPPPGWGRPHSLGRHGRAEGSDT